MGFSKPDDPVYDPVPPGSRWLEKDTNRIVVILGYPNHLWFGYEDEIQKSWSPPIEDFFLWKRFTRLT